MCRDFVGIASCVGPAGSHDYNQTAYRETRDGQTGSRVLVSKRRLRINRMDESAV